MAYPVHRPIAFNRPEQIAAMASANIGTIRATGHVVCVHSLGGHGLLEAFPNPSLSAKNKP